MEMGTDCNRTAFGRELSEAKSAPACGNTIGAGLNTLNALIPGVANKYIDKGFEKGMIGLQGGNILKGGNNVKSNMLDYVINK